MGRYRITVEGEGPFETTTKENPLDADRLLERFRLDLVAGGHKVWSAALRELDEAVAEEDEPEEVEDDDQGDDEDNEATGPGGR